MNILVNFFASIMTLFSGLLGHTPVVVNVEHPAVVTIKQTATVTPVLEKPLAENISTTTSSAISDSDLLTYSNKKYGIELKYPRSLTEMGTSSSSEGVDIINLGLCPTEGDMCKDTFSLIQRNYESINAWYVKNTNGNNPSIKPGTGFEDLVINGLSARKIISPVDSTWRGGVPCYITVMYSKGKIFEICDNLNNQVTKSIINSIVIN